MGARGVATKADYESIIIYSDGALHIITIELHFRVSNNTLKGFFEVSAGFWFRRCQGGKFVGEKEAFRQGVTELPGQSPPA
ncbi:hypothetical protein ABEB36_014054 [Hypothenemus hampei]|uniref:Uncharacterized protein n=1 Tax=Hypothenemus hampei TaxID=57062 RepID=A0ABD1E3G6_HYPHA